MKVTINTVHSFSKDFILLEMDLKWDDWEIFCLFVSFCEWLISEIIADKPLSLDLIFV